MKNKTSFFLGVGLGIVASSIYSSLSKRSMDYCMDNNDDNFEYLLKNSSCNEIDTFDDCLSFLKVDLLPVNSVFIKKINIFDIYAVYNEDIVMELYYKDVTTKNIFKLFKTTNELVEPIQLKEELFALNMYISDYSDCIYFVDVDGGLYEVVLSSNILKAIHIKDISKIMYISGGVFDNKEYMYFVCENNDIYKISLTDKKINRVFLDNNVSLEYYDKHYSNARLMVVDESTDWYDKEIGGIDDLFIIYELVNNHLSLKGKVWCHEKITNRE